MTDNTHPCDYAFPVAPGDVPYWQPGMTLRDWFAGQALVGVKGWHPADRKGKSVAEVAYSIADRMLEERNK